VTDEQIRQSLPERLRRFALPEFDHTLTDDERLLSAYIHAAKLERDEVYSAEAASWMS
jgi:hypothetical protein